VVTTGTRAAPVDEPFKYVVVGSVHYVEPHEDPIINVHRALLMLRFLPGGSEIQLADDGLWATLSALHPAQEYTPPR
jgi:hypothetical protein